MKKRIAVLLAVIAGLTIGLVQPAEAKVKLPALVADGMVLQHSQNINIWGWADPGEEVTITFIKKKYKAVASPQGQWNITIPATKPGGPHQMTINNITLSNILVGDVFLCSGQSNMELTIARVMDMFAKEVNEYTNNHIRYIKIPLDYAFDQPRTDTKPATWNALEPESVMQFSALCYFFGKEWNQKHGVPVGLINSAVGGSPVEAWISEEALKPFPKYLNQRDMYTSNELNAVIRQAEQQRTARWNEVLHNTDPGLHASPNWYHPQYNDEHWPTVDLLDTHWSNNGLNAVNGSYWFRRNFHVTKELAQQQATLRLGCIVDADFVYVNGQLVGTTAYQYPPRIYHIPAGLLHEGSNQITIRLISHSGRAHFVPEKPYKLIIADQEIPLQNQWKQQTGAPMPPAPPTTTLQYQPVGLYNAMIAPIQNYTVAGTMWYQGESNTDRHNEYADLLTALIADWRAQRNQPNMPFVVVELASFGHPGNQYMQNQWEDLRKAQRHVANTVPHTALAPAKDLGEWNDIHPLDKKTVAKRIAAAMEQLIERNN
ncbi:sialate O-acetylesterase [Bacteroides sp. OttesenSCG-928-D19]|nr:sialate O-acetylesterase [Bacteroides sp. OttesenSCG-928-D19]